MSNDESKRKITKKKRMLTRVNISDPWYGLLDWNYHKWKNRENQSLVNQILNDEFEKNKTIIKNKTQKIAIRRIKIKSK